MRAPRPELARFGASTAALPNCREEARSSFWLLNMDILMPLIGQECVMKKDGVADVMRQKQYNFIEKQALNHILERCIDLEQQN